MEHPTVTDILANRWRFNFPTDFRIDSEVHVGTTTAVMHVPEIFVKNLEIDAYAQSVIGVSKEVLVEYVLANLISPAPTDHPLIERRVVTDTFAGRCLPTYKGLFQVANGQNLYSTVQQKGLPSGASLHTNRPEDVFSTVPLGFLGTQSAEYEITYGSLLHRNGYRSSLPFASITLESSFDNWLLSQFHKSPREYINLRRAMRIVSDNGEDKAVVFRMTGMDGRLVPDLQRYFPTSLKQLEDDAVSANYQIRSQRLFLERLRLGFFRLGQEAELFPDRALSYLDEDPFVVADTLKRCSGHDPATVYDLADIEIVYSYLAGILIQNCRALDSAVEENPEITKQIGLIGSNKDVTPDAYAQDYELQMISEIRGSTVSPETELYVYRKNQKRNVLDIYGMYGPAIFSGLSDEQQSDLFPILKEIIDSV